MEGIETEARWVAVSDEVIPEGAVVGCESSQGAVYITRAQHYGCTLPGKLIPGRKCIVSWKGKGITKHEYEVLCNAKETWQFMKEGDEIPREALAIGYTKQEGKLFVGRVLVRNRIHIIGKVLAKDKKCYVYVLPEKMEVGHTEFEILTVPSEVHRSLAKFKTYKFQHKFRNSESTNQNYHNSFKKQNNFQKQQETENSGSEELIDFKPSIPRAPDTEEISKIQFIPSSSYTNSGVVNTNEMKWVMARDGKVPPGAVVGGGDHIVKEYVARAEHNGELIPGKLIRSLEACVISLNGKEIHKQMYQVLCEENIYWHPIKSGGHIPSIAIPGGFYYEEARTLYIGRAVIQGNTQILGKVDKITKICTVLLQDGRECKVSEFDILVSTDRDAKTLAESAAKMSDHIKMFTPKPHPKKEKEKEIFLLKEIATSHTDYDYITDKIQATVTPETPGTPETPKNSGLASIFKAIASFFRSKNPQQKSTTTTVKYVITKIQEVENSFLWDRYLHSCERISRENNGDINEQILFHGSPKCQDIAELGFDERYASTNGLFGAGIYFAEHSSKSNYYTGGTGCMLMCRVALGKVFELTTTQKFCHSPPGYHSVKGVNTSEDLKYPEYIIYRGEQAFPSYIITYKITS